MCASCSAWLRRTRPPSCSSTRLTQWVGAFVRLLPFHSAVPPAGTKRYEARSGGEREIQRTMLELLTQLDGFDNKSDIKVKRALRLGVCGVCGG